MGRLGEVASVASVKAGIEGILTTKGDILHRDATEAARLAVGADNEITKVATDILNYEAGAGGGGGVWTREGGNTTEATTTSTSATDLLSVASLTIATTSVIFFIVSQRKTTGATSATALGLKLNTTVTGEASGSTGLVSLGQTSTVNAVQSRLSICWIGPRTTNYNLRNSAASMAADRDTADVAVGTEPTGTADQPSAEITDLVIRGISDSASNTLGADELNVYTLSRS